MNLLSTRLDRCALRCGLEVTCGLLALVAAGAQARGQCSPQELAKLIASDAAASDHLGFSVAVSGDTAVVGARYDSHSGASYAGSAYVFVLTGGAWTEQAKLIAADAEAEDYFGWSVAVSGDTAVIGAPQDNDVVSNTGSAYVFVRSGTVWTQQAKLTAPDPVQDDQFGTSVAISGDTTVVGAWLDDHEETGRFDVGSAYVFVRSGTAWTQQATLTASDEAAYDYFGYSVAVSGNTVVIGAQDDDYEALINPGSAYVFVRSGTAWTQQAKLIASDAATGDYFGGSVAVSGDTVLVGSNYDNHAGGFHAGSAYVFVKPGGGWADMSESAKLIASDAAAGDQFGNSVALAGDTAVIGAHLDYYAGSAYIFVRAGGVWTQQAKLNSSDAEYQDEFGISVAVSGDTAVVGAYFHDNAGGADAGSAYVFDLQCAPVCCTGDFDSSNAVTNADIPDFVTALLAGGVCPASPACCPGDFNADGVVNGADMPGFLAKLFAGGACP